MSENNHTPANKTSKEGKAEKASAFRQFLLSLFLFVATLVFFLLILPHLYELGFSYDFVKSFVVPVSTVVTLFMGYRAERKLGRFLSLALARNPKRD